ncbi:HPP family protein [Desulfovibrionales bacterium]
MDYFRKMRGTTQSPPRVRSSEMLWSWIGAFLGMALIGLIQHIWLDPQGQTLLLASFGATCVLIFGAARSPLAQPRNVLGGHVLSACVGVVTWYMLGSWLWLAAAVAVATAIVLMHLTKTLHPPGGATALNAIIGGEAVHNLGFWYVLTPVACGAVLLLCVAVFVNNIPHNRRYPEFWL